MEQDGSLGRTKIDEEGRVRLPTGLLEYAGLAPGDTVSLWVDKYGVQLDWDGEPVYWLSQDIDALVEACHSKV